MLLWIRLESMRPPRKHHYIPEWLLSRWRQDFEGEKVIWEFRRQGPENRLTARYRHPGAAGYQRDLYTLPRKPENEAAKIETDLLQVIDDRGAKAVALAENNQAAGPSDKMGLVQFMLSMLHRSPERIAFLERGLKKSLVQNAAFQNEDSSVFRAGALDVFVDLLQSDLMISRMMELSTFVIRLDEPALDLMISDASLMMSNGLVGRNAFIMLPTSPRTLIMLAEDDALPKHMVSHSGKIISRAINDAVVAQAKSVVFATNRKQERFIDNRLGHSNQNLNSSIDPITGLVRWKI